MEKLEKFFEAARGRPVQNVFKATTVGGFRDSAILTLMGVFIGAACWSFIASVSDGSYYAFGFLLFIILYPLSVLRAMKPKFFGTTVIASLMVFQAVYYTYVNGGKFDENNQTQLLHTMASYAIGVAICWFVNAFIFPEFADVELKTLMGKALASSSLLLHLVTRTYLLEATDEENAQREKENASLRATLGQIAAKMVDADAEFFKSELDIDDYNQIQIHLKIVGQHLAAINASLSSSLASITGSDEYSAIFARPLSQYMNGVSSSVGNVLDEVRCRLLGCGNTNAEQRRESSAGLHRKGSVFSLKSIETRNMPTEESAVDVLDQWYNTFENEFQVMHELFDASVKHEASPQWESLLEVNFFIFGLQAIVDESKALSKFMSRPRVKKWHFRVAHYVPSFLKWMLPRKAAAPKESQKISIDDQRGDDQETSVLKHSPSILKPKPPPITLRKRIVLFLRFFSSPPSIYALKGSTAVLILAIVLFNQASFFIQFTLNTAVITLLVMISPSLGQTYLSFFTNLCGKYFAFPYCFDILTSFPIPGTCFGALWAFVTLVAWRNDSENVYNAYGQAFFVFIFAIPFVYIYQSVLPPLGILSLLSYSSSLTLSYMYRHGGPNNVPYDRPEIRLYKQLAATTMGVTFVLLFQVVVYPNLARRLLREEIANIIALIDEYYVSLVSLTYYILPAKGKSPKDKLLRDETVETMSRIQLALPSKFAQINQLLSFAKVEPRLEAKFEAEQYQAIISALQVIADRLLSGRTAVGSVPFIIMEHQSQDVMRARHDLQATVRLLFFIHASSLTYKNPLPPHLPSAVKARHALFKVFVAQAVGKERVEVRRSRDFIRYLAGHVSELRIFANWILARIASTRGHLRFGKNSSVAQEVDRLGKLFKQLFGEAIDPVDAAYHHEPDDEEEEEWNDEAEEIAQTLSVIHGDESGSSSAATLPPQYSQRR
ncbi:hypothetical protein SmJEL517_g05726 [Synchytrium microbalum]|uniref:DUF2421 domain-containing protein n=1 Tax=Synchytrium microbalum TaxID=1806994 RepID=A0A507BU94_9FUNG|nr:uncharacterized protein SmJEL517_g05726 [Synchytrium microbalum]TPX30801.1 hypothetical protein SmJEL517_g05726 [Synchytrium microbalum]